MTVNEMIERLQKIQAAGNGEREVIVRVDEERLDRRRRCGTRNVETFARPHGMYSSALNIDGTDYAEIVANAMSRR